MKAIKSYLYPSYGLASIGKVAVEVTLQLYLFDYYTRILGLSPLLAGAAFAVAILWDALSDIILSAALFKARTHKIPYSFILWIGALILALATVLLFSTIAPKTQWLLFIYLLLTYSLVNTGMTLLDLPQSSLSAELSHRADERNKLLAAKMGFGILGLAVGSILPGLFLEGAQENANNTLLAQARSSAAWVLAIIVTTSATLTAILIRSREKETEHVSATSMPTLQEVARIFQDRPYRKILIAGVVAAIGRTINAALALMYYRFVLKLSEEAVTLKIFPIFTLSIIASIPFWIWVSKIYGKRRPAYAAVAGLGVMGIIAYPLLPAGETWPALCISTLGGVLCGAVFLVESMITDMIDHDEDQTGKRKEALYFAVWKSGAKIARAFAFVAVGIGLELIGLDESVESVSRGIEIGIILLFGVLVGLCFIVSGGFIYSAKVPKARSV